MPTSYQICLVSPFLTMISAERAHPSICSPKLALRTSDKKNSDKRQPWNSDICNGLNDCEIANTTVKQKGTLRPPRYAKQGVLKFRLDTYCVLLPIKGPLAVFLAKQSWFVFTFSKFIWFLMTVLKHWRSCAKPSVCIFILTVREKLQSVFLRAVFSFILPEW